MTPRGRGAEGGSIPCGRVIILCPCGGMVDTSVSNTGSARSESSNLSEGTLTNCVNF